MSLGSVEQIIYLPANDAWGVLRGESLVRFATPTGERVCFHHKHDLIRAIEADGTCAVVNEIHVARARAA